MKLRIVSLFLIFFLAGGVCLTHYLFKTYVGKTSFKGLAEQEVGRFFKADVKIEDIDVGFLNEVALKNIQIGNEVEKTNSAYEVQIEEVIFKYNWKNIFTQNFQTPSSIVLDSPEISLPGELFPYAIFSQLNFGNGQLQVSKLKLVDGYIRYPIPAMNSDLELYGFDGRFTPKNEEGQYAMDFQTQLRGFLIGEAQVRGNVDVKNRKHILSLDLKNVDFGDKLPLPLRDITGMVHWHGDELSFDRLEASLYGWKINLRGKIRNISTRPEWEIKWYFGKRQPLAEGSLEGSLSDEVLHGYILTDKEDRIELKGKLLHKEGRYYFEDLKIAENYGGAGWLDLKTGNYQLKVEGNKKEIFFTSNLRTLDFKINLKFKHWDLYGLDLVSSINVFLISRDHPSENRVWRFQGTFDTDYFILEFMPLFDLHGSFELTPYGIHDLISSWGKVFNLMGSVSFKKKVPQGKFTVRVDGFDLATLEESVNRAVPKNLKGLLEGKLKCEGPLDSMELFGSFTIKSGQWGRLEYDLGAIQFRGIPPYLKLNDSYLARGRTHFYLDGALDFSLDNIFHGLVIRTSDKFAIWKGWELNTSTENRDLELKAPSLPKLAITSGSNSQRIGDSPSGTQDEDNYVVVGPKIQF